MGTSVDPELSGTAAQATSDKESPYDVTKAAPGYANVTGLVSTFALAAVVLIFLIAAPGTHTTKAQYTDMSFATILFAVGFLGCLLGAFAFSGLSGAPHGPASLGTSMLIASAVAVCLLAILGGFEALARAFLPQATTAFAVVCAITASLSPVFVWFALFNVAAEFPVHQPEGYVPREMAASAPGPNGPRTRVLQTFTQFREGLTADERQVIKLLAGMTTVGVLLAVAGLLVHIARGFGRPQSWEYYVLGFWGLAYTGLLIVAALLFAIDRNRRLAPFWSRTINALQCGFMFFLIAVLP